MDKSNIVPLPRHPDEAFGLAFVQYLRARAEMLTPGASDATCTTALDAYDEACWNLIRTPGNRSHEIAQKVEVLRELQNNGGDWTDRRDSDLANSILCDLEAL